MNKFINKVYKNNTMVYKVLLFLISVVSIVYLFPKGGQFKYDFNRGTPWQYDNLYATFDFSIQKTGEELDLERQEISRTNRKYFVYDDAIVTSVKTAFTKRLNNLQEEGAVNTAEMLQLVTIGNLIINEVYKIGFIDEANQNQTLYDNTLIFLRKNTEVEEISYRELLLYKEVLAVSYTHLTLPTIYSV